VWVFKVQDNKNTSTSESSIHTEILPYHDAISSLLDIYSSSIPPFPSLPSSINKSANTKIDSVANLLKKHPIELFGINYMKFGGDCVVDINLWLKKNQSAKEFDNNESDLDENENSFDISSVEKTAILLYSDDEKLKSRSEINTSDINKLLIGILCISSPVGVLPPHSKKVISFGIYSFSMN
jgi:hypothetical protein